MSGSFRINGRDLDYLFDKLFDGDPADFVFKTVSKLPDVFADATYPPANIYVDKDKNYVIQVAVAGWKDEEIKLSFDDMRLVLELTPQEEADKNDNAYLQRGIRYTHTRVSYGIHPRYDLKAVSASQKDGILTIKFPLKEEAKPFDVSISKD